MNHGEFGIGVWCEKSFVSVVETDEGVEEGDGGGGEVHDVVGEDVGLGDGRWSGFGWGF